MAYIFKRFIDKYRPGDKVPDGKYDEEQITAMIGYGVIEAVEAPAPAAKKAPARKKAAAKK